MLTECVTNEPQRTSAERLMLTTLILKANLMYLDRNAHYKIVFTIPPVTS